MGKIFTRIEIFYGFLLLAILVPVMYTVTHLFQNGIPGNLDLLFAIASGENYINHFLHNTEDATQSLFGQGNISSLGESSILPALVYVLVRLVFSDLQNAVLVTIALILMMNFLSLFFFLKLRFGSKEIALIVACFFCFNSVIFKYVDTINVIFFAPAFVALYFLQKNILSEKKKFWAVSCFFMSVQLYCSVYAFLISIFFFLATYLSAIISVDRQKHLTQQLLMSVLMIGTMAIPYILFHVPDVTQGRLVSPWNTKLAVEANSIDFSDHFRSILGTIYQNENDIIKSDYVKRSMDRLKVEEPEYYHILSPAVYSQVKMSNLGEINSENYSYQKRAQISPIFYTYSRKSVFSGFIFLAIILLQPLFIFGSKGDVRKKIIINSFLMTIGLIISYGPFFQVSPDHIIRSPLYYIYNAFPFMSYARVLSRFYLVFVFFVAVNFGDWLSSVNHRFVGRGFIYILLLVFLVENIPFREKSFHVPLRAPDYYSKLSNASVAKAKFAIVDFPSELGFFFLNDYDNIFLHNREIIYMIWQTQHHINTINGTHGYLTDGRLKLENLIQSIETPQSIEILKRDYQVKYIVIHKDLVLLKTEQEKISELLKLYSAKIISEKENYAIIEI